MKLLEVGNLGGQLAGFGFFFICAGIVIIMVSVAVILILGIMSATSTEKKYNFKAPLIGILVGILTFIAGGCICGFSL
ncbi:hypothetical protein [Chryseobacterium taichungense]|uniref:hypothetical protein n=1 Tax=Chryseobacterium taichungense TaxID=295069 RepID=UPI0028ACB59B|nr:hypothetical protein [Chryseobacterium taichungense]